MAGDTRADGMPTGHGTGCERLGLLEAHDSDRSTPAALLGIIQALFDLPHGAPRLQLHGHHLARTHTNDGRRLPCIRLEFGYFLVGKRDQDNMVALPTRAVPQDIRFVARRDKEFAKEFGT